LAQQGQQRKPRDSSVPIKNRNGSPELPDLTRFRDANRSPFRWKAL